MDIENDTGSTSRKSIWTSAFPPSFEQRELETEYRESYFTSSLPFIRVSMGLVIALFFAFYAIDFFVIPDEVVTTLYLRLSFVVVASFILGLTFTPIFKPHWETWMWVLGWAGTVVIVLISFRTSQEAMFLYPQAISFVILWFFVLSRLRFKAACIASIVAAGIFDFGFFIAPEFLLKPFASHNFFIFSAFLLGAIPGNFLERFSRNEFLAKAQIEAKNVDLSAEIDERRAAQEAHAKSLMELETVLGAIDYGVVFMDPNMRVRMINKAFQSMWNIPDEILKSNPSMEDLMRVNEHSGLYDLGGLDFDTYAKERIEAAKKGTGSPVELNRADGRTFMYQSLTLPGGELMLTYFDVTNMKEKESELKDALGVISNSIRYAARIQQSILPDSRLLDETLSEYFIVWEPRDVVGGDVYWMGRWGNGLLVLLGDCTGHGVPGAFMTLISIGALERAMIDVEPGCVGELIQRMHQFIQISLHQHEVGGQSDDGIELGACFIVPDETTMTFSGARFDLFSVADGEVQVTKGTKQGAGYRGIPHDQKYEDVAVPLVPGCSYYMTSDGYIDQIGGEKQRGFGKRRYKELLLSVNEMPFNQQKVEITQALTQYQGMQRRRDDVSMIGFQL